MKYKNWLVSSIFLIILCVVGVLYMNKNKMKSDYDVFFGEYLTSKGKVTNAQMHLLSSNDKIIPNLILRNQSHLKEGKYVGYLNDYHKWQDNIMKSYDIAIYDCHSGEITILTDAETEPDYQRVMGILNNSKIVYSEIDKGVFEYDIHTKKKRLILNYDIYKKSEVFISEDGLYAYFCKNNDLVKYDLNTKESSIIANSIGHRYIISKDNSMAVSEKKTGDKSIVSKIDLNTGEVTELFTTSKQITIADISEDNSQIIYKTISELGFADVSKTIIYAYDINNEIEFEIYKSKYFDSTRSVCWGEKHASVNSGAEKP